jgi:hypothetical protein
MTVQHRIDLSTIPLRPGQSLDLEAKRRRIWEQLPEEERASAVAAYEAPVGDWVLPCLESGGAYERVLYVLVVTGKRLTPGQIAYVLLARWYHNTDAGTVRARLAIMVRRGHAKWTKHGLYYSTDEGVEYLRMMERAWLNRQRVIPSRRIAAAVAAGSSGAAERRPSQRGTPQTQRPGTASRPRVHPGQR